MDKNVNAFLQVVEAKVVNANCLEDHIGAGVQVQLHRQVQYYILYDL